MTWGLKSRTLLSRPHTFGSDLCSNPIMAVSLFLVFHRKTDHCLFHKVAQLFSDTKQPPQALITGSYEPAAHHQLQLLIPSSILHLPSAQYTFKSRELRHMRQYVMQHQHLVLLSSPTSNACPGRLFDCYTDLYRAVLRCSMSIIFCHQIFHG